MSQQLPIGPRVSFSYAFEDSPQRRHGEQYLIEVKDGERPLDVFNHPFAYARRERLVAVLAGPTPATSRRSE
jgi:hypothetical protein